MKSVVSEQTKIRLKNPTELLKSALQERFDKNPQYSLRSFARATGISHTVLSLVLSGKRSLSKKATLKLADYLNLGQQEKMKLLRSHLGSQPEAYQTLQLDAFEVISDWYHYAILSLMDLPNSQFDARWISKQLGIQVTHAKMAMSRLQRLELIQQETNGQWRQTGNPIKIENKISTAATRKFHKQVLNRAINSIDKDPIPVRDFSSMTFVFDQSQMEYARKKIQDFRRKLVAELEVKGSPSAVYNLTIQMYPVSNNIKGE